MKSASNSQTEEVAEVEVLEEENQQTPSEQTVNATFNQQNNYHLTSNIDLDKLTTLSQQAPDLANRVMDLYENQQKHNIRIDKRILTIEETEQKVRIDERPYQRKFAFRALNFAMGLSILSLGAAVYLASLGHTLLAGTAITIPIGVAVANMLGFKAAGQTKNKEKDAPEKTKEEN